VRRVWRLVRSVRNYKVKGNAVLLEALRLLQRAKERRESWFGVARNVRALRRTWARLAGGDTNPLVQAADASGYSPNLLARFVSVMEFAERLAAEGHAPIDRLQRSSFVSLEYLKRIWVADPGKGRELLDAVLDGDITVRDLKVVHRNLRSPPDKPRERRTRDSLGTERILGQLLKKELRTLTGSTAARFVTVTKKLGPFVHADYLAIRERDGKVESVVAIEVKSMATFASAGAIDDAICRTALRSTYFNRYWVIPIAARKAVLDRFASAIRLLALKNVGIAEMDMTAKSLRVLVRPSSGPPVPDRRGDIVEMLRARQWDQL
jgi:hypothetical protein